MWLKKQHSNALLIQTEAFNSNHRITIQNAGDQTNISTFLIISSFFCFVVYIQDLTFWRKLGTSMGLWHSTTTRISKAIFPNIFKGCRSHTTMKYISFIFQPDIDIGQLTRVKPVFLYLVGRFGAKHTLESFYNFNLQHLKTSLLANPWRGIQKNKVYIFVRMLTDKNISLDITENLN